MKERNLKDFNLLTIHIAPLFQTVNFSHSLGHKSVEVFALNQPSSSPICNHTVYLPGLQLLNFDSM